MNNACLWQMEQWTSRSTSVSFVPVKTILLFISNRKLYKYTYVRHIVHWYSTCRVASLRVRVHTRPALVSRIPRPLTLTKCNVRVAFQKTRLSTSDLQYIPNPRMTTREWRSDQTQTTAPSLGRRVDTSGVLLAATLLHALLAAALAQWTPATTPALERISKRGTLHVALPLEFGALNFDGELMI